MADYKLVYKSDSNFMKFLNFFLKLINKNFMDEYTTTIGTTIYLPTKWDTWSSKNCETILAHEKVHLKQQKEYGSLLFSFLYLFVFFPVFFAHFRVKFEMEAYEENIKFDIQTYGVEHVKSDKYRNRILDNFLSSSYGWMGYFRKVELNDWFDKTVIKYSK